MKNHQCEMKWWWWWWWGFPGGPLILENSGPSFHVHMATGKFPCPSAIQWLGFFRSVILFAFAQTAPSCMWAAAQTKCFIFTLRCRTTVQRERELYTASHDNVKWAIIGPIWTGNLWQDSGIWKRKKIIKIIIQKKNQQLWVLQLFF